MILLTSDGITSPQLEEEIKKALVPISRRAALVTTASCRYKEKDHNVPVLSALMRRFGPVSYTHLERRHEGLGVGTLRSGHSELLL